MTRYKIFFKDNQGNCHAMAYSETYEGSVLRNYGDDAVIEIPIENVEPFEDALETDENVAGYERDDS